MSEFEGMQTEAINEGTRDLDRLETPDLVRLLANDHAIAVESVENAAPQIAALADRIAGQLRAGGRLHYVGSGTSGRLAYLDAAECPPTFGTPRELVCAHIAGGPPALTRAVEGAEDDGEAGANEMRDHVGEHDVVIGLSASGGPAYVVAALLTARGASAWTVAVVNNERSALARVADEAIVLDTGPEALTGSTRLKAGSAQKIFLNTLSTSVMTRLGKVYDNLMVDVVAGNKKLRARALHLVQALTGLDEAAAATLLASAGGSVKVAVVMQRRALDAEAARDLLERNAGSLRASL
ncbi:MAG: N-acetylmuramic acid 6-phosphate etherase [Candidatus Eremiobacteraeota bacterium]|nr:N-acetylmuramic acid 6-phosphate etherase [Candidatus Eremiobacteraeota bacterium]